MSKKPLSIHILRLTYGNWLKWRYQIKSVGYEKVPKKGPFLLLSNHAHALDPFFISSTIDAHVRWVAGAYLFKNQILKTLLTILVGSIGKQQGRSDLSMINGVKDALRKGDNVGIFPEGTRTWDGEFIGFDKATAKFIRLFKVPVVLVNLEGAYGMKPRWASHKRKGSFTIRVVDVLQPEQIQKMKIDELLDYLLDKLNFNYSEWQERTKEPYKHPLKAERIEQLLYLCPSCNGKSTITSSGNTISCSSCSFGGYLDDYDNFISNKKNVVKSIPAWHKWEKEQLKTLEGSFSEDKGVLLQRGIDNKLVTLSKNFSLSLEGERMVVRFKKPVASGFLKGLTSLVFDFDKMSSMIINAKGTVEFFNDNQLWRVRIVENRSILKYVEFFESRYLN